MIKLILKLFIQFKSNYFHLTKLIQYLYFLKKFDNFMLPNFTLKLVIIQDFNNFHKTRLIQELNTIINFDTYE